MSSGRRDTIFSGWDTCYWSSSHASHQKTDGAGPSTVLVADRSVPFAPSNAPSSVPAVERRSPPASARHTRLRFVSSRRRGAPDYLEHRFTDVISAVEALREEVRKSERDRKESDKVRDEQHKELVRMIQTLQGTSTQMYTDDPFHYEAPRVMPQQGLGRQTNSVQTSHEDIAALHRRDSVPPPQQGSVPHPHQDSVPHPHQDSVEASHEDTAALPRRDLVPPPQQDNVAVHDTETFDQGIAELPHHYADPRLQVCRPVREHKRSSQTITPYTDPCRRKKSKTEAAHKFCPADPVHRDLLDAYL
ncbi:hypothetical protein Q3G72_015345 [Acer saccharum]|nr:hypothetical protein Q3G72_015345 [Acer saccharum]